MDQTCTNCTVTAEKVQVGGRSYCGSCGEPGSLVSAAPVRRMSDLGKAKATVSARPATSLHQRKGMAKGGVVDLRSSQPLPQSTVIARRMSGRPAQKAVAPKLEVVEKIATAKLTPRSEKISRFHTKDEAVLTVAPEQSLTKPVAAVHHKQPSKHLPAHAETHHQAMTKLAKTNHNHHAKPSRSNFQRYAGITAAVVIMSGYVWLQNYPKMELHSASSKAGFSLILPSYLPSSYSLNGPVEAVRGRAIMSFKSPSIQTPLKITQQQTTWDSSSLRDNVISEKSKDFTSVQGQGLTIYLWGKNQAAWVNHGVWYGIEGTGQLSREQILKIAYSL